MPLRSAVFITFLFALALGAPLARAADIDPAALDAIHDEARASYSGKVGGKKAPAVAYALVVDGDIKIVDATGKIARGEAPDVGTDTSFALGDISKLYMALLALKLDANGKLALTTPIARALPDRHIDAGDFGAAPITLRDLLIHHGGFPPNRLHALYYEVGKPETETGIDDALYLAQPPGRTYAYSNIGYDLAADAIARAGGENYEALLSRDVLQPLGLARTTLMPPPDAARPHFDGKPRPYIATRDRAAMGVYSSISDLAKLLAALTDEVEVPSLPHDALDALTRVENADYPLDLDNKMSLAFGLHASKRAGIGTVAQLTSFYPGYRAEVVVLPEKRIAVAALSNSADADDTVEAIDRALIDGWMSRCCATPRYKAPDKPPAHVDWPPATEADTVAEYYSTPVGLLNLKPNEQGYDIDVLGQSFTMLKRDDGWYQLRYRLFGLIPLNFSMLRRVLVAPAKVSGERILMAWTESRRYLLGSAWQPQPMGPDWQAVAGEYAVTNPDALSERMHIDKVRLVWADQRLVLEYDLPGPIGHLQPRIPLVAKDAKTLVVPGIGPMLGERIVLDRDGATPRLTYSGYRLERRNP